MKLTIARYNPETDQGPDYRKYHVPDRGPATVLQALMYIYDEVDSTLAFSFDCRYKKCGLCAMMVNGRPRLACLTSLEDGQLLEPLRSLPVLRDLTVDRRQFFAKLGGLAAYLPERPAPAGQEVLHEPAGHHALAGCNECLACMAACPEYGQGNSAFGGPLLFVKLAQLKLDPRDRTDREGQARDLGVELCRTCPGCACPSGIPIRRGAVAALLGETGT